MCAAIKRVYVHEDDHDSLVRAQDCASAHLPPAPACPWPCTVQAALHVLHCSSHALRRNGMEWHSAVCGEPRWLQVSALHAEALKAKVGNGTASCRQRTFALVSAVFAASMRRRDLPDTAQRCWLCNCVQPSLLCCY